MLMNQKDINEILTQCKTDINTISTQCAGNSLNKVTLKNTLENMRSILDYLAKDINDSLKQNKTYKGGDKVYFPYGQRENHFKKSIEKNLPNLSNLLPQVYAMIEKIQPYRLHDNWLIDLCELTNEVKHNQLSRTEERKSITINQGGIDIVQAGSLSEIIMTGNTINGVLQDDIHVGKDGSVNITKKVSDSTLVIESNSIYFNGKNIKISPFMTKCLSNLESLTSSIYQELPNK